MSEQHTTELEIWRKVSGYEKFYEVSNHGRIRSFDRISTNRIGVTRMLRGREILTTPNRYGHCVFSASDGFTKKPKRIFVHRAVLTAFVGECPSGMETCHNDGNPGNNRPSNLRWDTCRNNALDKKKHGNQPAGENHGNAKLSLKEVGEIRVILRTGRRQAEIAKIFGVKKSAISKIATGRTWANQ